MRALIFLFAFLPFTGLTQNGDSILNKQKFEMRQLVIPASFIGGGFLINNNARESVKNEIVEERNEHIPGFHTHTIHTN